MTMKASSRKSNTKGPEPVSNMVDDMVALIKQRAKDYQAKKAMEDKHTGK